MQLEVAALDHFSTVGARAKLLEFLSGLGHSHPGSVCGAVYLEMTACSRHQEDSSTRRVCGLAAVNFCFTSYKYIGAGM